MKIKIKEAEYLIEILLKRPILTYPVSEIIFSIAEEVEKQTKLKVLKNKKTVTIDLPKYKAYTILFYLMQQKESGINLSYNENLKDKIFRTII